MHMRNLLTLIRKKTKCGREIRLFQKQRESECTWKSREHSTSFCLCVTTKGMVNRIFLYPLPPSFSLSLPVYVCYVYVCVCLSVSLPLWTKFKSDRIRFRTEKELWKEDGHLDKRYHFSKEERILQVWLWRMPHHFFTININTSIARGKSCIEVFVQFLKNNIWKIMLQTPDRRRAPPIPRDRYTADCKHQI